MLRVGFTLCEYAFLPMCSSRGGDRGSGPPPPPEKKSKSYRVSSQYWSEFPGKSQSYQASFQCWTIIGPPAKRHLNGVSLTGRLLPAFSGIWILSLLSSSTKNNHKKTLSKLSWAPSDKTFRVRPFCLILTDCIFEVF